MAVTSTGKEKYRTFTDDIDVNRGRGRVNLHEVERLASAIAGGAFVAYGLLRRTWPGLSLAALGAALVYRGATGHCSVYQALGANTNELGRRKVHTDRAIKIEKSITINRPAADLYRFWRNLENLPRVMKHLESVVVKDDRHSHWVAKGPLGLKVEWEGEVISEIPNELIGWRSVGTGDVDSAGSVHFEAAPGDQRTLVRVILQYDPPAGLVGAAMAKILGEDPESQVEEDLGRFKQLMEGQPVPMPAGHKPSGEQAG